jgi:predicted transposase YdaD
MVGEYAPNGDPVFHYKVVDIRDLDEKRLLESDGIEDNVLAILAKLGDEREAIRQIMERIAHLGKVEGRARLEQLSILAGLRRAGHLVEEEAHRMPVTESMLDHDLFGPIYKEGLDKGLEKGREEGRQEGRQEGELILLRRQIAKRFGPLPAWLEDRLSRCSASELEALSDRVLDAQNLDDLVK